LVISERVLIWSSLFHHHSQHGSKGAESTKNNINRYSFTREMVQDGYTKETKT